MYQQQEIRLIAAFKLLHQEERSILLDLAETRALKQVSTRPKLRLVAGASDPANSAMLSGTSG